MGKPKKPTLLHPLEATSHFSALHLPHPPAPPPQNVIYSIYSHTVALSNVMMTDAWERSRKRDCKIKYEAIYPNCPVRLIYCNNNEVKFSAQEVRNAFLS